MITVNEYRKVGSFYIDTGEEYSVFSTDSILCARPISPAQSDIFIVYTKGAVFLTDLAGVNSFGSDLVEINSYRQSFNTLKGTGLTIRVNAKNVTTTFSAEPGYATDGITPVTCVKIRLVNGFLIITDEAGIDEMLQVPDTDIVRESRTISTTGPLSGGGDLSANRTISIPAATASVDGHLTATDWATFNGKQAALGFTPVPETRTLTINGTAQDLSADRTFTIATGLTVGTTPITSGTVGMVLFEGTGNVLQQSGNLFWDNANGRLGIGTSSPTQILELSTSGTSLSPSLLSSAYANDALQAGGFVGRRARGTQASPLSILSGDPMAGFFASGYHSGGAFGANTVAIRFVANQNFTSTAQGTRIEFLTTPDGSATRVEAMRIAATSNVLIGTTTDAGFKLDVNGTARVQGQLTVSSGAVATNNLQTVSGGGSINMSNGQGLSLNPGGPQTSFTRITLNTTLSNSGAGSSQSNGIRDILSVNLTGTANEVYVSYFASPTITSLGNGDYRGFSWTNNLGWGLYGSGTARNYLNGNLLLGTTTDAGFKLDVNGTARVSGNATIVGKLVGASASSANGSFSLAYGESSTAAGAWGFSFGRQAQADAEQSFSIGYRTRTYLYGQVAQASTTFANANYGPYWGIAQSSVVTAYRVNTSLLSSASLTLSLDGSGTTNLIIPDGQNRVWNVVIDSVAVVSQITGTATGVVVGDVYRETKSLVFKRRSGTSSIVGSVDTTSIKSDTSMSSAFITISAGTSQQMQIEFTSPTFAGGGSVFFKVMSRVSLVELTYA